MPSRGDSTYSTSKGAILPPSGVVCVTRVTVLQSHIKLSHSGALMSNLMSNS